MGGILCIAGNLSTYGAKQSYDLVGNFENIGGLKVRAPVKSAGVVVGRVTDIQFSLETYDAVVTMRVGSDFTFPKDTFASILTAGLLGEQYIGLDAGGDEAMLKDGDKIMITNSAIVLEEMIGRFLFDKAAEDDDEGF